MTSEQTANKMLDTLLNKLDKAYQKYNDHEMTEIIGHMVTVLTHRMVSDALSIRNTMIDDYPEDEIMRVVSKKFSHMKEVVEAGVTSAFEVGVSESYNQDIQYQCKIGPIPTPSNTLLC